MKRTIILILPLCLLFAVGCKKDNSRISIFAENMSGDSKVWVDPAQVNGATWLEGETVNLNGDVYTIAIDDNGFYLSNTAELTSNLYAIYPASLQADGNNIAVVNNNSTGTITISSLAVNFTGNGHEVIFPMASTAEAGSDKLLFNHLTGGMRVTLANATATIVASVKMITYGDEAIPPVALDGITVTTQWAAQGPTAPMGDVGQIEGDQDIKYSCEMSFAMQTNGEAGVTIPDGGDITFCVPVTVRSVKRLTVIGYDTDGTVLFTKTRSFTTAQPIERNHMYSLPTIQIN
ncbi:MAG: hypothetical protein IK126_05880 [Bacteroidales bacterium]|nr:hypothetical protein [Bacteroidales bacterium]